MKELTEQEIKLNMAIDRILADFMIELERIDEKFPEWSGDPIYAVVNVTKEAGELLKEYNEYVNEPEKHPNQADRIEREAIKIGAMALRFLLNFTWEIAE